MIAAAVVPDSKIILVPFEADLQVVILSNVTEQVLKNVIGFILCQFNDTFSESKINNAPISE